MTRRLPPLPALRAFEAAARHLSFRRAAEELSLTPSAISHQVRALETFLDRALFRRAPEGLALTADGARYLADLGPLLDGLDASTRAVSARAEARPIRIHCTPGFAARWLVPRLDRFDRAERVTVSVSHGAPCTDFATNGADVVIHWGTSPIPGARVEPMMESVQYPVAAPQLVAREGIETPRDLLRLTAIRAEVADAWEDWLARAGLAGARLRPGPRLAHCELSLTAAERGQGVTLAYDAMARGTVAEGRLARLFDVEVPAATIYAFAFPESRRRCPDIRALREWMFDEVAAEGTAARSRAAQAAE